MKKVYLICLISISSLAASGQIYLGGKGGLNVSTLSLSSGVYNPRLGYHAGLYYMQRIEEQYGLQLELQYSLQGARDATIQDRRLAYNYLHLPVLVKFYFDNDIFLSVGPQLSYLLKANSVEEGFKQDITSNVRSFDLSILVGTGKETDFGNFGLRFGWGALNTSGGSVGNSVVFRNLLMQLYVGFKIKDLE